MGTNWLVEDRAFGWRLLTIGVETGWDSEVCCSLIDGIWSVMVFDIEWVNGSEAAFGNWIGDSAAEPE